LSRQFEFQGPTLATAISKTFANRKTPISTEPVALASAFADDPTKQTQWKGFLRKARLVQNAPPDPHDVVQGLPSFLQPVAAAARDGVDFDRTWNVPGPWRAS